MIGQCSIERRLRALASRLEAPVRSTRATEMSRVATRVAIMRKMCRCWIDLALWMTRFRRDGDSDDDKNDCRNYDCRSGYRPG
jgi:hypothetical protein